MLTIQKAHANKQQFSSLLKNKIRWRHVGFAMRNNNQLIAKHAVTLKITGRQN